MVFDSYNTYVGLLGLINHLETEQDIRIFLSKYKKWYIQEKHLTKKEAEDKVKMDLKYCLEKFTIDKSLSSKFYQILNISPNN
ncbi:MAG: hypothetical protein A2287_06795 [Candidatus Melainabacteria bacterium RIFOXYA12_FULL_32_12]|nr:MAG: hypothetical protein A2255_07240 [Candidatus Melainabacteria bacterium RIFOXYA2_FULL_32_9]OGI24523.1 MAG: hypothetical protein A2287_06795 [Candidatus Melainabacteria bacterium RIFOXYA12_FULL_32_12]